MTNRTPTFETVFAECKDSVYRMAFALSGNAEDAAEITQDAFMKVYRSLPEFRGGSRITTWVYEIARNTAISHLRKRKLRTMQTLTEENNGMAAPGRDAGGHAAEAESRERLREAVLALPSDQQAVVTLFYFQELATREMAKMLGFTESKIKTLLFRARKSLHATMQAEWQA